jgi:hypothetical protein
VREEGAVTRAVLAIARAGADEVSVAEQVCRACASGLDVDGAALSVLTETPARKTLAATDGTAELLEELQFSLGEGACMQAAVSGDPVLVADLAYSAEAGQWPVFAAMVAERTDVRALFALPLRWGAVTLGVLDLYRRAPGALGGRQQRDALAAVDTAALMMLGLRTDPDGEDEWLDPVVSGRMEVHQATGMVLMQLGVSAADALARLRGHAFAERRLLIEVARDVVARRLSFSPESS